MATIRPFSLFDMLEYNNINLDILTETVKLFLIISQFGTHFYGKYITKWPEYCITMINCTNNIQAYCKSKIFYNFSTWKNRRKYRR